MNATQQNNEELQKQIDTLPDTDVFQLLAVKGAKLMLDSGGDTFAVDMDMPKIGKHVKVTFTLVPLEEEHGPGDEEEGYDPRYEL